MLRAALALLLALPLGAQARRAEAILASLTLEQRAGQLQMAWILSSSGPGSRERAQVRALAAEGAIGGVVISLGSTAEAAGLIADLQRHAALPLLVAGDFETSVAFRLRGATSLGNAMLLGAAGSSDLAEAAGRITAREARALGAHWVFAPVLDVNVNPANPIINVRSFGEDPAAVARLGTAFVRGVQGEGLLATGKHFPGHGDVSVDSHIDLPVVAGARERLDRVELAPFRAAIAGGLASIMTGHLAVPALCEEPGLPATLSRAALTGLLRETLRFDGIVVTDALDMGGVKQAFGGGEVAVRALAAGADLLLMPPAPAATRDALAAAVRDGRVPQGRLDEACLRLLRAKERLGLLAGGGLPDPEWPDLVGSAGHRLVARGIAARGLTLVRDRLGHVPLPRTPDLILTLLDKDEAATGAVLAQAFPSVRHLRVPPEAGPERVEEARQALAAAQLPLVALHVRVRSYSGRIGLPGQFAPIADALRSQRRSVVVSFGNPYLLREMPDVSTYLCAFDGTPQMEGAVAEALAGTVPVVGRLPVTIPEAAERGTGLTVLPGRDLARAEPAEEGFAPDLPARVAALLQAAVRERTFPGAVALVTRRGRIVAEVAAGRTTYADGAPPVRPDSLYDLASLTKVCATAPAILRLVAQGKLQLDQKVAAILPGFLGPEKDGVAVRHLLTHSAGLHPFHRWFTERSGKEAYVAATLADPLRYPPGTDTRYSDLGMILLMAIAERVSGREFAELCRDEVFTPLGMAGARFGRAGTPLDAAPTEECVWRGRLVQGEVHDENAFAMGGVSGHAGLFGTARDVARLGNAFLAGGRGWLPGPLAREAVRCQGVVAGSTRALGFDTFAPGASGGSRLAPEAFGHTGFTGTSLWCDPRLDLCIVLLGNRVHPTRDNPRIQAVRGALADLVVECLRDRP